MSFVIRMKRSLASLVVKNETMYRRKSICAARKKINVTKKSTNSSTAGVTKASTGVTMPNCDGSTAIGHRHAGTRLRYAGSARVGALLRDIDLFSRGANGFPPIHGFILHDEGCQAPLHSYYKRH